jgi:threonine/homoserine/homoserine lactone efflux protein
MDFAMWVAAAVIYLAVARTIGRDTAAIERGGRGGWRYALTFIVAPCLGLAAWYIDRRRFGVQP